MDEWTFYFLDIHAGSLLVSWTGGDRPDGHDLELIPSSLSIATNRSNDKAPLTGLV